MLVTQDMEALILQQPSWPVSCGAYTQSCVNLVCCVQNAAGDRKISTNWLWFKRDMDNFYKVMLGRACCSDNTCLDQELNE